MTTQRTHRWRHGRLTQTNLGNFWRVSLTQQDPAVPNLPLESPAGGIFFLSLAPGSYSVVGFVATAAASKLFEASPGAYVVSGANLTLAPGKLLSLDPGVYLLTGLPASFLTNRAVVANPGSYVVLGFSASIYQDNVLNADPGLYVLVGFNTELSKSGVAKELIAEPGIYLVTGSVASTILGKLMSLDPGSYTVEGLVAGLRLISPFIPVGLAFSFLSRILNFSLVQRSQLVVPSSRVSGLVKMGRELSFYLASRTIEFIFLPGG